MARPKKQVEKPEQLPEQPQSVTVEVVEENVQPVTVTGKAVAKGKGNGVRLRSLLTGKIITGVISTEMARQQVRDFPNRVEIVNE